MSTIEELESKLKTLQTSLEETQSELEKYKTKSAKNAWVHEYDRMHFYIQSEGDIAASRHPSAGPLNSFPDHYTAERMLKWLKLMDKMRIAADGFDIGRNVGYYLIFNGESRKLNVLSHRDYRNLGTIYFDTNPAAYTFMNSLTKDEIETFKAGFPVY